jgi:hypothetical protein
MYFLFLWTSFQVRSCLLILCYRGTLFSPFPELTQEYYLLSKAVQLPTVWRTTTISEATYYQ